MVKQAQTIRRGIASELFVFDHFVGLELKGLKKSMMEGWHNLRFRHA